MCINENHVLYMPIQHMHMLMNEIKQSSASTVFCISFGAMEQVHMLLKRRVIRNIQDKGGASVLKILIRHQAMHGDFFVCTYFSMITRKYSESVCVFGN